MSRDDDSGDTGDSGGSGAGDDLRALAEGAAQLGVPLDAQQLAQFARLRDLLLDWNTRVNLTAITDPAEVVTKHFLDSLTCVLALPLPGEDASAFPSSRSGRMPSAPTDTPAAPSPGSVVAGPASSLGSGGEVHRTPLRSVLDVGAGAGFPGLPLAIARPDWRVTLLEATGKKVRFIEAAIADLALPNATAVAGRAEDLAHQPAYRGKYDVVTARAVAALPTLLEYCCPFARVGATLVFPKKGELAAELAAGARAAAILGAELLPPIPVPPLADLTDDRVLIAARQRRPCPPQYPRAAGAPAKRPLGS